MLLAQEINEGISNFARNIFDMQRQQTSLVGPLLVSHDWEPSAFRCANQSHRDSTELPGSKGFPHAERIVQ